MQTLNYNVNHAAPVAANTNTNGNGTPTVTTSTAPAKAPGKGKPATMATPNGKATPSTKPATVTTAPAKPTTPRASGNSLYPPMHVITALVAPAKPFKGVRAAQWATLRNGITVAAHIAAMRQPTSGVAAHGYGLGFLALCVGKGLCKVAAPVVGNMPVRKPASKGKGKAPVTTAPVVAAPVTTPTVSAAPTVQPTA